MARHKIDFEEEDPKPNWRYEVKPRLYTPPGQKPPPLANKNGPTRAVVRVAPADRRLDNETPADPQSPDITGRYQSDGAKEASGKPAFLLHVNQAGKHVEALLVRLPHGHQHGSIAQQRFYADLKGDGVFAASTPTVAEGATVEGVSGEIRQQGEELIVNLPVWDGLDGTTFYLRDKRATFLDQSLDSLIEAEGAVVGQDPEIKALVESIENLPLSDAQRSRLRQVFTPEILDPLLKDCFGHGSKDDDIRRSAVVGSAEQLDIYLGKAFDQSSWSHQQWPQVLQYVRTVLTMQTVVINDSRRSELDWIETVAAEAIPDADYLVHPTATNPDKGQPTEFPNLTRLLGITEQHGSGAVHKYLVDVDLTAHDTSPKKFGLAPFHLRAYEGTVTVSKMDSTGRKDWVHPYKMALVGPAVILGKGGAEDVKARGSFESSTNWTPADFPGWVILHDAGVWAGNRLPVTKELVAVGHREPVLVLRGRGNHREQLFPLKGADALREGLGGEYSFTWGRIYDLDTDLSEIDYSRPMKHSERVVTTRTGDNVHFEFGSALLKGAGRYQVRVLCAIWLRWLESARSTLRIVGHADTVDTKRRNDELSLMRATNVVRAIEGILGPKLAIPDIKPLGLGKQEADEDKAARERAVGHRLRDTPDVRFRKVEIELNGQCVLVLWGA